MFVKTKIHSIVCCCYCCYCYCAKVTRLYCSSHFPALHHRPVTTQPPSFLPATFGSFLKNLLYSTFCMLNCILPFCKLLQNSTIKHYTAPRVAALLNTGQFDPFHSLLPPKVSIPLDNHLSFRLEHAAYDSLNSSTFMTLVTQTLL